VEEDLHARETLLRDEASKAALLAQQAQHEVPTHPWPQYMAAWSCRSRMVAMEAVNHPMQD
jgi:hypothetical protein